MDNPHIAVASRRGSEGLPESSLLILTRATFPIPLTSCLPCNILLLDVKTSNVGHFSLPVHRMRKTLQRSGAHARRRG
ncbi:hypothetical protein BJV74DRAFT_831640 [Russula compacta]|nr:hypothetical protein BJV74DRAFT_831640 [Russula compacta]